MLSFNPPPIYQASKCYVTHGVMGHLDPAQPPSKGKPWATLTSQDFVHKVRALFCICSTGLQNFDVDEEAC
jgi:ribonuclease P/MRP protein subunit RPP40